MNGARFVHDRLELAGWQVEVADAQKVKGLAPSRRTTAAPSSTANSRSAADQNKANAPSNDGRLVVTLRAQDSAGRLSLLATRSIRIR